MGSCIDFETQFEFDWKTDVSTATDVFLFGFYMDYSIRAIFWNDMNIIIYPVCSLLHSKILRAIRFFLVWGCQLGRRNLPNDLDECMVTGSEVHSCHSWWMLMVQWSMMLQTLLRLWCFCLLLGRCLGITHHFYDLPARLLTVNPSHDHGVMFWVNLVRAQELRV